MSTRYRNVKLASGGLRARLTFEALNSSAEAWRAEDGFAFGYHIFDADTGTLIVDGPRVPVTAGPGEWAAIEIDLEIPPEPGAYRVFVSPLREKVAWFYSEGWPFLLAETRVNEAGQVRKPSIRVTTRKALASRDLLRSAGRAFLFPMRSVWRNRSLIRAMVRRDVLGRYRGSFAGAFWTVLNPLLLMCTYFFVFGVVLQARFGADPSRAGFALYFLAGMLPWLAFSEAAGRAPTVMLEHRNFIKKLVFPVETLPVNLVLSGLVSEFFTIVLFTAGLLLARGSVPLSVLWLPALLVPQVLFTAGACWTLAALGVFARDLGHITGFLLTLWFFVTPICYPESALPAWAAPVLAKNPIYVLVRGYRTIFLEGHAPPFGALWKLWLVGAAAAVIGHAWFYKLRNSFADII